MNWLDFLILTPVLLGAFSGLRSGLIRSALTLAGVVTGIIIAGQSYGTLADAFAAIDNRRVQEVAAFALIVFATVIAFGVLGWMLRKLISLLMLGWVDRVGGAIVGAAIGLLFSASIVWAIGLIPGSAGVDAIANSLTAKHLLNGSDSIRIILPSVFDEVREVLDNAWVRERA